MTTPTSGAKVFYSCLDTGFIAEVPQPIQHQAVAEMAKQVGGSVVFYTMEDHYTLRTHEVLLTRLNEKPDISGVIFFRIGQFSYSDEPRTDVMTLLLERGLELHFARERISIYNKADLDRIFPFLYLANRLHNPSVRFYDPLFGAPVSEQRVPASGKDRSKPSA